MVSCCFCRGARSNGLLALEMNCLCVVVLLLWFTCDVVSTYCGKIQVCFERQRYSSKITNTAVCPWLCSKFFARSQIMGGCRSDFGPTKLVPACLAPLLVGPGVQYIAGQPYRLAFVLSHFALSGSENIVCDPDIPTFDCVCLYVFCHVFDVQS